MAEDTEKADGGHHEEQEISSVQPRVNPGVRTHGVGVWGNERIVMGVRVDGELKESFKRAAVALYGSVCNPVEGFMVAVVEAYKGLGEGSGLTPGLTVGNRPEVKVEIGNFHVERLLRPRRKLDPVPHQEVVEAREADVEGWAEKVLAGLPVPHGTQLGPVYEAMRALEVPGGLQAGVMDIVIGVLSKR